MAERCCPPGSCAYTPSRVGYYLAVIRHLTEYGEDAGEAAESALASKGEGRSGAAAGGSGLAHGAVRVWDVQQARAQLGRGASAEQIARRLCPYAMEGVDDTMSRPIDEMVRSRS